MKRSNGQLPWLAVVLAASCSPGQDSTTVISADAGVRRDVGPTRDTGPVTGRDAGPPGTCVDTDRDGLSDTVEGAPAQDTDGDGMPDFRDVDSDNDGYTDADEARRAYPRYESMARALTCGGAGDNCDGTDSVPNQRDADSDDDGLTDREEFMAGTNPCNADTDGDGATDLIESAAMSDGRSADSRPPENSLYVVLPYYPPPMTGMHEFREFTFSTRIRLADVFFLVDNSASMQPVIAALRTGLDTIVRGVQMAIPDVRVGVGSFDSMPFIPSGQPGSPGDYTLWIRQAISPDVGASQRAFNAMHTIDDDTGMRFFGGDNPEDQTEAIYEVIEGGGSRGHEGDAAALRSVHNALDPGGNGWVPRVDPARDCGATADNPRFGWGCFAEGRVPIVVLASDAPWYDGCFALDAATYRSAQGHNCDDVVTALNARGGFFVGIDVGAGIGGATYANSQVLATRTRTTDASGAPVVFGPGRAVGAVAAQVVDAVTRLASGSRQDITTRTVGDPAAMGIPMGHTTADFIRAVVPVSGEPAMPTGYDRQDMTTFYNVSPSTRVTFRADFFNDFVEGGATAKLFRATINVLGRGGTVVDTRPVFIVVPARGSGIGVPG
jgi:hypothetical protein